MHADEFVSGQNPERDPPCGKLPFLCRRRWRQNELQQLFGVRQWSSTFRFRVDRDHRDVDKDGLVRFQIERRPQRRRRRTPLLLHLLR